MQNNPFSMTVPLHVDSYRPRIQRPCHSVIVCHGVSRTYARGREKYPLYLLLLPYVYKTTMTYHDTMTIVEIAMAVAVIVDCHSKIYGDTTQNNNYSSQIRGLTCN